MGERDEPLTDAADRGVERRESAWELPLTWLREEKFWRDILTRVVAGVLTAAIIYLGALLLGYLHTPELGATVLLALGIAGALLLLAIAGAVLRSVLRRPAGSPLPVGRIVVIVILGIAAVALVVGVVSDVVGR